MRDLNLRLVLILVLGVSTAARALAQEPPPVEPALCDDRGDPLPPGACARYGSVRWRHADSVLQVSFHPRSPMLASLGRDRTVRVWDRPSGKQLLRFGGPSRDYQALAFSPKGDWLVLSGHETGKGGQPSIEIRRAATGALVQRLVGHRQAPHLLQFRADGVLVSVGSEQVCLWDCGTGEVRQQWQRPASGGVVALSPDGQLLASAAAEQDDLTIQLWDTANGARRGSLKGHHHAVLGLTFSPDGRALVSSNPFEPVCIWDVQECKLQRKIDETQIGSGSCFTPDGRWLALGTTEGTVRVRDFLTGKVGVTLEGYRGWINRLTVSPDGRTLALAGTDSRLIHLWDLDKGKSLVIEPGHRGPVHLLELSPDGHWLVSAGENRHDGDRVLRFWHTATCQESAPPTSAAGGRQRIFSLAFAPAGGPRSRLAVGSDEEAGPRLFSVPVGTSRQLGDSGGRSSGDRPPAQRTSALAFTRDGALLAAGHTGCGIELWDPNSGVHGGTLRGHQATITALAFAPDGPLLASAGDDRTIRLWDVVARREIRQVGCHEDAVRFLRFTPDGKLLVAGSDGWQGQITLWDVGTGRPWLRCAPLGQKLAHLALAPDGRTLAVALTDHTLRVLELSTGQERCRFAGHDSAVHAVLFTPDSRRLLSGSADTTILAWDLSRWRHPRPGAAGVQPDLVRWWNALAAEDASAAYQAMCLLAQHPALAVPFLTERLAGWRELPPAEVHRLLTELDHPRYAVREKAAAHLARLGEQIEPLLRQRWQQASSPEERRRLELLLQRLDLRTLSTEQLRALRAFEVLEWVGTGAVHQVLRIHATEGADARLGWEARSVLQRLQQQVPPR